MFVEKLDRLRAHELGGSDGRLRCTHDLGKLWDALPVAVVVEEPSAVLRLGVLRGVRARILHVARDSRAQTIDVIGEQATHDDRAVSLSAAALVKFSDGIAGSIRPVLASHDKAVDIRPATESEHAFLRDNFDLLFPPSDPLDRSTFHALAKLVLVRRIIKALVSDFGGLVAVQRGLAEPLVVDVRVVLEGDVVFRVHTVAPKSNASGAGQRLGIISE